MLCRKSKSRDIICGLDRFNTYLLTLSKLAQLETFLSSLRIQNVLWKFFLLHPYIHFVYGKQIIAKIVILTGPLQPEISYKYISGRQCMYACIHAVFRHFHHMKYFKWICSHVKQTILNPLAVLFSLLHSPILSEASGFWHWLKVKMYIR